MEFLESTFIGWIIGVSTFLIIGLFHPIVVKLNIMGNSLLVGVFTVGYFRCGRFFDNR